MAKGGAKIASKNDPRARNKGQTQKVIDNKIVKPVKVIDRGGGFDYMAGCYESSDLVTDEYGQVKKWKDI